MGRKKPHVQIFYGLEICKRRQYIAVHATEGYIAAKHPTIQFNHSFSPIWISRPVFEILIVPNT